MSRLDERFSILEKFRHRTLLELVPQLPAVAQTRGQIRTYGANETVCKAGEPLHQLMLPISAPLALFKIEAGKEPQALGYLIEGRSLCLREFLEDAPAPYEARAERLTQVLCIPKFAVTELLDRIPTTRRYLMLMTSSSGARSFKHFLAEREVPDDTIIRIVGSGQLEPVRLPAGAEVALSAPAIHLVDSGKIAVTRNAGDHNRPAQLSDGSWFGCEALVPPHTCSFTARTVSETTLRVVPITPALQVLLNGAGVVEDLVREPWISGQDTEAAMSRHDIKTTMPGEAVGREQLEQLRFPYDPSVFRRASSDLESYAASLVNFAKLRNIPVNDRAIDVVIRQAARVGYAVLASAIEPYGLLATPLATTYPLLKRQSLPCLTFYGPRLVVLLQATKRAALLLDPCQGVLAVRRAEFERLWCGSILDVEHDEFVPMLRELKAANDKKLEQIGVQRNQKRAKLTSIAFGVYRIFFRHRSLNINIFLFGAVATVFGAVGPKLSQFMIDEVLTLKEGSTVVMLMAGMVLMTLLMTFKGILASTVQIIQTFHFDTKLSQLFYRHAMTVPSLAGGTECVAEFQTRFSALTAFEQFITKTPEALFFLIVQLIFYAGLLLTYDIRLAGLALLLLPLTVATRAVFRAIISKTFLASYTIGRKLQSGVSELISSIASVKAANAELALRTSIETNFVEQTKIDRRVEMVSHGVEIALGLATHAVQLGTLYVGAKLAIAGSITYGEVMAVGMYSSALVGCVTGLAGMFSAIEQGLMSGEQIAHFFLQPTADDPDRALVGHAMVFRGKIKLESVSYRYDPEAPWVVKDLNLTIYPRQVLAIVGRSGCGKTTLAKLLGGSMKPTTGRVFFDDFDATLLSEGCRQRQIGFIMQDNELFSGAVRDNITYADDLPDQDLMETASRIAGVSGFISQMPRGFDTHLAEGGHGLSGGQRQRVSIARTLYQDPKVLIMDEATSALDAESEAHFIVNLREMLQGRTAIIVAHRLSTIRAADRIVVMQEGQIVEDGSHDDLIAQGGVYAELFETQIAAAAGA